MKAVTHEAREWLERARDLEALTKKFSDFGEEERRLPQPLFDAVRKAGIFRMLRPRVFGGEELEIETAVGVIEELARQDGSLGWNAMLGFMGGLFADYLPETAAYDIFGDPDSVSAGSFAPSGQAIPVELGYRLTGRWSFASGCQNATWMVCGCTVMVGDTPKLGADGTPEIRLLFVPASDCEILDTWHTTGMRGTGSHDFTVSDVFVPAERSFPFSALRSGPVERPNLSYRQPFMSIAPLAMSAVSLGIARDAIESFKTLALSKTSRAGTVTLAGQHTVHEKVGLAEALLRSSRAYLYETARQLKCLSRTCNQDDKHEQQASARLAGAFVARSATESVDLMFDAGGGTSIYAASRLDRCFRNVHMVTHHIAVAPSNIEMAGQYFLGLGLQVRR